MLLCKALYSHTTFLKLCKLLLLPLSDPQQVTCFL